MALAIPGRHNVLNALAAIAVATEEGVSDISIRKALDSFAGVGRRFEQHARRIGGHAVLPDRRLRTPSHGGGEGVETARETFPGRRRVAIYQPHRFTRTRDLFDAFVRVLSEPDLLILLEVYSAGEAPIPGADAAALAAALRQRGGVLPVVVTGVDEVPALLPTLLQDGDVVLTQGAGDIGRLTRLLAEEGGMARASTSRRPASRAGNPGRLRRWFARTAAVLVIMSLALGAQVIFSRLNAPVEVVRVEEIFPEAGQARLRELLGSALPSGIFTAGRGCASGASCGGELGCFGVPAPGMAGHLRVTVEPEVPVARWRDEALLSNRGRIIAPLWDNAPGALPALPAPRARRPSLWRSYLRVAEMLQGHQLAVARVEESAAGDIEVTLQGGVHLRLGTDAQVARLRRVDAVLSAALAAQLDRVDSIDARYDNGVAVAWREGAAGERILALRDQRLGKER